MLGQENRVVARCDNLKFLNYYKNKNNKPTTSNPKSSQIQVSSFYFNVDAIPESEKLPGFQYIPKSDDDTLQYANFCVYTAI